MFAVQMSKQFYFKQFSVAQVRRLNVKAVLSIAIQFSISTLFSLVLFGFMAHQP